MNENPQDKGENEDRKRQDIEKDHECDRFFIDPDYETSSFISYHAGYDAFISPRGDNVVFDDFSLKIADCSRQISLFLDASNKKEINRSRAKLDRIRAGLDALEDYLSRLESFYDSHPDFEQSDSYRENQVIDSDYDEENGEWKRGRIKRR